MSSKIDIEIMSSKIDIENMSLMIIKIEILNSMEIDREIMSKM